MPELPEVETIVRGLNRLIIGKKVVAADFDNPKSFPNAVGDVNRFLIGASIIKVERRAKVLLIRLDTNYTLITHLKMTGQLVFDGSDAHFGAGHPSPSLVGKLPDKTTRVTISFVDGNRLYFNDLRKFGWMRLYPTSQVEELPFFQKLGPEPLDKSFTWQDLKTRLARRKKTAIKTALMDQSVLSGVGNIYADESLWGAKIHPATLVGSMTDKNYMDLHQSLRDILTLSIDKGGSTDRNYVDAEGKRGSYLDFASVFRRQGQPCPRCGHTIVKIRLGGRGTHFCPHCQKQSVGYDQAI